MLALSSHCLCDARRSRRAPSNARDAAWHSAQAAALQHPEVAADHSVVRPLDAGPVAIRTGCDRGSDSVIDDETNLAIGSEPPHPLPHHEGPGALGIQPHLESKARPDPLIHDGTARIELPDRSCPRQASDEASVPSSHCCAETGVRRAVYADSRHLFHQHELARDQRSHASATDQGAGSTPHPYFRSTRRR